MIPCHPLSGPPEVFNKGTNGFGTHLNHCTCVNEVQGSQPGSSSPFQECFQVKFKGLSLTNILRSVIFTSSFISLTQSQTCYFTRAKNVTRIIFTKPRNDHNPKGTDFRCPHLKARALRSSSGHCLSQILRLCVWSSVGLAARILSHWVPRSFSL